MNLFGQVRTKKRIYRGGRGGGDRIKLLKEENKVGKKGREEGRRKREERKGNGRRREREDQGEKKGKGNGK